MLRVAGLDDLRRDRLDGVDRDREAQPDVAAGITLDLRVDADHLAVGVEQGAARVAVVQRGVGLDHVVDRVLATGGGDHALKRADDSGGHGAVEPERIADRDDRVADVHVIRVPEGKRRQRLGVDVDLQHGDIGRGIGSHDSSFHALVVREADADGARALDDVVVRDDVAGLVDHEARAERLLALALRDGKAEEGVDRLPADDLRRRHLDDARGGAPVDLVDRERLARAERSCGRG